ncbi:MAG: hypothetical protein GX559_01310 [Candidatus Pacebacteria bacterium]|nr:hypothetical protein [Candidatus Paceibacterota bacterium]
MNKKLQTYYKIIFLLVLIQLVSTVATLTKNIAYGQQIELLKKEEASLISQESVLNQAIAQEISIQQLADDPSFEDTTNYLVLKVKDNALALR